ncbi:MAG: glycosyltransferase family 2 protein [Candidatus Brennerbacteria bacterium]|nr:glycosyltransferase family 2 protein [Candidatus Brennerbacteria bacterium]
MSKNNGPLVSICVTFSSAEEFIHRVFDSCLNQTYRNIEVVVVDNASTDGSERVVRKYAAQDPRIKYFRRAQMAGLSSRLLEMFQQAGGEFVMMIGADDWLARDYIKNGVQSFLDHPGVAGIVPRLINLSEIGGNQFKFLSETFGDFSPPRAYSAKWFVKRMYRSEHLYISALALMRKEDAVKAMDYFVGHYCNKPLVGVPSELKGFWENGFGVDAILFLEVLTRYHNFVFDSSLRYLKVAHGKNLRFDLGSDSLAEIFKNAYYYLLTFKGMYAPLWNDFYREMKIFWGAETIVSAGIYLFRFGMRSRDVGGYRTTTFRRAFFGELSLFETVAAGGRAMIRLSPRGTRFIIRKLLGTRGQKNTERIAFKPENFLDQEGRFKVS